MKSLKLAAALSLLTVSATLAQDALLRRNTVSVHPFMSFLVYGAHVTWERDFGEGYWSSEIPFFLGMQPGEALNLGGGIGLRRYFQAGARGWYVSPQFVAIDFNQYGEGAYNAGHRNLWLVSTLRGGYKWELGRLTLDGALGGGYLKDIRLRGQTEYIDYIQPEWTPVFRFSAGWKF